MKSFPKLVLFDLDGTLIKFHHDYLFEETKRILQTLKHPPVERQELEHHFSLFDYFKFVLHDDQDGFVRDFWAHYDHCNYPAPEPLPGAHAVLEAVREQGAELAIVTARTTTSDELKKYLAPTGFLPFFSHLRARDFSDDSHWSDKQRMLAETVELFGVAPKEAIMIGDIPADIQSAKRAGLGGSVAVESGGINRDVLTRANPDTILPDISHLPDYLAKRFKP